MKKNTILKNIDELASRLATEFPQSVTNSFLAVELREELYVELASRGVKQPRLVAAVAVKRAAELVNQ